MEQLAAHLRYMQLCAHNYHNLAKGSLFFADHKYLGSLYEEYEDAYDSVVERSLGLGLPIDLVAVQKLAAGRLEPYVQKENKESFKMLLQAEQELCGVIEQAIKSGGMTEGTKQFLGNICDQSESRQYKLKQRTS